MTITIQSLRELIKHVARDDIRTVEALLVDVCDGNEAASRMLHQLLWWWNSEGKPDVVYKSHKDWYNELRLKRGRVDKAVKILATVCEITIKKARGNPTRHFKLNITAFLRRLSDILDTSIERITGILNGQTNVPNKSKGMYTKEANVCAKNEQTITTTISNNHKQQPKQQQQKQAAAENMPSEVISIFGNGSLNRFIEQYGFESVRFNALAIVERLRSGETIRSPGGMLRTKLRYGDKPIEVPAQYDDPTRFISGELAQFINH